MSPILILVARESLPPPCLQVSYNEESYPTEISATVMCGGEIEVSEVSRVRGRCPAFRGGVRAAGLECRHPSRRRYPGEGGDLACRVARSWKKGCGWTERLRLGLCVVLVRHSSLLAAPLESCVLKTHPAPLLP